MSFEKISETEKKTNLFLFALYTFISIIAMFFFPFAGFLGLAFLSVPVTIFVLKRQTSRAIWCSLISVILVFLVNYILALTLIALIFMVAYFYRYSLKEDKDIRFRILGLAGSMVVALLLYILLFSIINGFDTFPEIANGYNSYIDSINEDPLFESYRSLTGTEGAQFDALIAQLQAVMKFIPKMLPGILIGFIGLSSILNYKFTHIFAKKYGISIEDIKVFKEWDLNWNFCWGFIFGLIFILIPRFNPAFDVALDVIGANLLVVFGMIYTVLGLSVIWSLFDRFKFNNAIRAIILIVISLFFGLVIVPILMGLVDIWANFRKLKRK